MKNEIKISLKTFIILIIIGIILIFAAIYFLLKNQNNNFEKENVTRELSNISEEDNKLAISIENKNENENEKTAENVVKGETVQINISKEILIGEWELKNITDKEGKSRNIMEVFGSLGANGTVSFSENGKFSNTLTGGRSSEFIDEGNYIIKNDTTIELKYDDGREDELKVSYNNEKINLIMNYGDDILYLSHKETSENEEDTSNNDIIGKWKLYKVYNKAEDKKYEPEEVMGSAYKGNSYLELKADGTFEDYIHSVKSLECSYEGTYEIQRNYYKNGDCYIFLTYSDGNKVTLQKLYFGLDDFATLYMYSNSDDGVDYYLKNNKTN